MKVLVAGSRSICSFDISEYIPKNTTQIICGGAKGVDSLAAEYAEKSGIPLVVIRPEYNLYGKVAPIKRNEIMVKMADYALIIWDGVSKGTEFTIKCAQNKGIKIRVVVVN